MIKYLKYQDEISDIYGNPIEVPNPDRKVQKKARDEAIADGLRNGKDRSEIKWDLPMVEATLGTLVTHWINSMPYKRQTGYGRDGQPLVEEQKLKAEDYGLAWECQKAFMNTTHKQKGYVVIEQKAIEWLVRLIDDWGDVFAFGTLPAIVKSRLDDFWESRPPELETGADKGKT